jgi:hypothetical protein
MSLQLVNQKFINGLKRLDIQFLPNYIKKRNGKKWIFISYITEPFKRRNDKNFFHGHQNHQETIIIEELLNELDLSLVFNHYSWPINFLWKKFDVVFGLEPNFLVMCKKNPQALKIYYATGAYYKHQNQMIIKRTNDFREKHGIDYPYVRMVSEHESAEAADYIFQIGSKFTIETYPEHLRKKIIIIDQTCHDFKSIDLEDKFNKTSKIDFIWFGSTGSILKGLDLVIEFFLQNPHLNLHIVGPVEEEFMRVYRGKMNASNNFNTYGFLNVDSDEFREIANKSAFLIYPSASEGCPGSVLNLQKLGVIPILSQWSSSDKISEHGYMLKNLSVESIGEAIEWTKNLTDGEMKNLIRKNHNYVIEKHNKPKFKSQFKANLKALIEA